MHMLISIFLLISGTFSFIVVECWTVSVAGAGYSRFHHRTAFRHQSLKVFVRFGPNYLTSALEEFTPSSFSEDERQQTVPLISWWDPQKEQLPLLPTVDSTDIVDTETQQRQTLMKVPLYPLPAVYLPTVGANHTLWNIERRNIQMILDLEEQPESDRYFCVVLRAIDTGRWAPVGTLMKLVHAYREYIPTFSSSLSSEQPLNIRRIVVTGTPVAIVDLVRIDNPHAVPLEYRLQNPNKYLSGIVRWRQTSSSLGRPDTNAHDDDDHGDEHQNFIPTSLCERIQTDYNCVRDIYIQGSMDTDTLFPEFSHFNNKPSAFQMLPPIVNAEEGSRHPLASVTEFWKIADAWQTLCETLRECFQMSLNTERNEQLVEAAMRSKPGPLQLPISMDDLLPPDRQRIQKLEQDFQQQWRAIQMDPCLDFQVLLQEQNHGKRLEYFGEMIARERDRLEALERTKRNSSSTSSSQSQSQFSMTDPPKLEPPHLKRGAWFRDDCW